MSDKNSENVQKRENMEALYERLMKINFSFSFPFSKFQDDWTINEHATLKQNQQKIQMQ